MTGCGEWRWSGVDIENAGDGEATLKRSVHAGVKQGDGTAGLFGRLMFDCWKRSLGASRSLRFRSSVSADVGSLGGLCPVRRAVAIRRTNEGDADLRLEDRVGLCEITTLRDVSVLLE